MYNSYFGFSESPFKNNLDRRFFFLSEGHQEALAALIYFVNEQKEFALLCGDVGTGKTMIVNEFLHRIPRSTQVISLTYSDIEYQHLIYYIADQLEVEHQGKRSVLGLINGIRAALLEAKENGKHTILVVDEAHLLPDKTLDHIRLLSNLETNEGKLIHILLVGQNELAARLDQAKMRQLRQRININRVLAPLSIADTIQYVDHRLRIVGSDFMSCFDPHCTDSLFKLTGGVPRLINLICDTALLLTQINQRKKVDSDTLTKASLALRSDIVFASKSFKTRQTPGRSGMYWGPIYCFISFLAIIAVVFFLGHKGYFGKSKTTTPAESINAMDSVKQPAAGSALSEGNQHKKFAPFPKQLPSNDDAHKGGANKAPRQDQLEPAATTEQKTIIEGAQDESSSAAEQRSVSEIPNRQAVRKELSASTDGSQAPVTPAGVNVKSTPSPSIDSENRSHLPLPDRLHPDTSGKSQINAGIPGTDALPKGIARREGPRVPPDASKVE